MAKRGNRPRRKASWKTVLWLVLIVYFSYLLIHQQITLTSQASALRALNGQKSEQEGKIAEMQQMLNVADTPDFIEYCLRTKLGWLKKDETVYKAK